MNATAECTLVACPNPMALADKIFATMPAGQTLVEMVGADASQSLAIEIGGHAIPRELWAHTRPKPGQVVYAVNYPQGGNAGKWTRAILSIAVIWAAWWAAPYLTGSTYGVLAGYNTAVVASGLALVGQLAVTPMIGTAREITA